jgi:hypothetical protein
MSIGTVIRFLWAVTFLLALVAFFRHAPSEVVERVNTFLGDYANILTSVGTLLLVGCLTIYATHLANISSEQRERNNRRIAVELKKAEFRQAWINSMREDLAQYSAFHWSRELQGGIEEKRQAVQLQARILMRMNPEDKDYGALLDALRHPVANESEGREALAIVGQKFLKREWERLKDDLDEIDRISS